MLVILFEVDTSREISENDIIQGTNSDDNMMELPSIYKMHPAYKDYLWGGYTLVTKKGKYFQVTDYKIPEHEIIQIDDSAQSVYENKQDYEME